MSQTEPTRRNRNGRNGQTGADPTTVTPPRTKGARSAAATETDKVGAIGANLTGFIHPAFAQTKFTTDPRIILDEIVRCGRGLQIVAEEIDSKDEKRRQKAHVAGTRYFFYGLGLLQSAGIILSPVLFPDSEAVRSTTTSEACKAAGIALERYIFDQFGGSPFGGDIQDLVDKLQHCFYRLTIGTFL